VDLAPLFWNDETREKRENSRESDELLVIFANFCALRSFSFSAAMFLSFLNCPLSAPYQPMSHSKIA
jgi:hypothetical protein